MPLGLVAKCMLRPLLYAVLAVVAHDGLDAGETTAHLICRIEATMNTPTIGIHLRIPHMCQCGATVRTLLAKTFGNHSTYYLH